MTADAEALRTFMRHWATGVAIITVHDQGQIHGMTVNSFTSVTLTPPLVLVCIERAVRTHAMLTRSGQFALSILAEGQDSISNRFAGRDTEHKDRFEGLETFTATTGAPILANNLGYLEGRVVSSHEAGTHTIFVAEVLNAQTSVQNRPLLYFNQGYRQIK